MSINHFSPDNNFPAETLWYHQQESQSQFPNLNKRLFFTQLYNSTNYDTPRVPDFDEIDPQIQLDSSSSSSIMLVEDRDSMFEKHLTPSDVGKLNRLVIPKQHAEKYFPLNNHTNGNGIVNGVVEANGNGGEKGGLLLSFEDESGKCWRFRYSYWNSSQSYVLTKGWSRYVKEKRLDAGDVVLFERHRVHMDRFFIGWRRRGTNATHDAGNNSGVGSGWARVLYSGSAAHPYPTHPFPYEPDLLSLHAGSNKMEEKKKRLRLFGVNMEVDDDDHESTSEPQTPDGSSLSSQGQAHIQHSSSSYNYPDQSYNHTF